MVIECPGSEWVIKLGPLSRTNGASTREQASQGALQQVREDSRTLLDQAKSLLPLLEKGAIGAGECGKPESKEEGISPQIATYQLPDGNWFSVATSGVFGYKLVCKKSGAEG
jgi:hypothetical protein